MIPPEWTEGRNAELKDGRTVLLRRAVPNDAPGITGLVNAVGAERRWTLRDRATWTLSEERQTLRSADGRSRVFFVAERSGRVIGIINLARGQWSMNSHVAELSMSCLRAFRGVGLGTALLRRGIQWARSVGVRKLTLEVFATNAAALRLYRSAGFRQEGRRQGHYRIHGRPVDSLLMSLWL